MSAPAVLRSRWAQAIMIATPLLVLITVVAVRSRAPEGDLSGMMEPLLPTLRAQVDELNRIEIERGIETTTLERRDGVWGVAQFDGYPARIDRLQELVQSLSALRRERAMTALAARHAELGLAWPDDSERSDATRVRLFATGSDAPFASVILGRDRWSPRSQYVRFADEDQTWRVLGVALAEATPIYYIDDELTRVPASEFVRIDFPGGVLEPDDDGNWIARARSAEEDRPPPLLEAPREGGASGGASAELEEELREAAEWVLPELLFRLTAESVRRDDDGLAAAILEYHAIDGTITIEFIPERIAVDADSEGDDPGEEKWWMRLRWRQVHDDPPAGERVENPIAPRVAETEERWVGWLHQLPSFRAERLIPLLR